MSPASIDTALSVLRDGSAGKMRRTLDQILPAAGPSPAAGAGRTAFATALWKRADLTVREDFRQRVKAAYAAEIRDLTAVDAAGAINRWASEATSGRIRAVVDRVDSSVRLLLASAAWFRGTWREAFDPAATRPARFTRADGTALDVPTMSQAGSFDYRGSERFQSVMLAYVEGPEVLELVLPAPGVTARDALQAALAPAPSSGMRRLRLWVPRFEVAYETELGKILGNLGLGCLFDPATADFSSIAGAPGELHVDQVRHTALLRVDESGTEAAAVTTATLVGALPQARPDVELRFDRPFLAILRASPGGAPVFIGYLASPSGP